MRDATGVLARRGVRLLVALTLAIVFIACISGCASQQSASIEGEELDESAIDATQEAESSSLSSFTVVIDAGHQAQGDSTQEPIGPGASETKARVTSGTTGVSSGVAEHEVNLEVALLLRDYLDSMGVNVIMVRETADVNISNSERAAIANEADADLFVRLHCDGSENSSAHGFSTLVPGVNSWTSPIVESSREAAEFVQASAVAATGAQDLGIVERTDLSGFNWCEVPTILCEMGFMSNADEDLLLNDASYQNLLATGIGDGIIAYLQSLETSAQDSAEEA